MKERIASVPTPDGWMPTFVTHPEGDGPFPAVVVFMDIWGVREELFDIARRIGTVGYYCVVPDSYYRQGEVRTEFRDDDNRMISLHNLDEERSKQVFEPRQKLTGEMTMSDTGALLEFFDSGEPVRPGPVGSIGYCMGGWHVLAAAGHFPERFQASASLHGTNLISDKADSPHHLVEKFQGELYCGFAELDPYSPPGMIEELDALLQSCAVDHRFQLHPGADHGYALPDRDIYDKHASDRDWEQIFAMFRRQIPPGDS